MARPATGEVLERSTKRGTVYALRFRAHGQRQYLTLGGKSDGWTRERAEIERENVMADVRRGIWQPVDPEPEPQQPKPEPDFRTFASEWYAAGEPTWAERTRVDYRWRLSNHLLPHFADYRLGAITVEEVDRYRAAKVREAERLRAERVAESKKPPAERRSLPRPLSPSSINKTIRLLAAIVEQAVEYGHIDRNPAQGKRRLLRESKPSRSYLQPDQVDALLTASGLLDREAEKRTKGRDPGRRRPILATMTLAGLRIAETLDLRWRHLRLAARKMRAPGTKTDAAPRDVDLSPVLMELLMEYRARARFTEPDDYVFATATGHRDGESNVRRRILAPAVKRANEALADQEGELIEHVTPHSLRRTFISLLLASGAEVPYVMAQAGHDDPKVTLAIYARVIASGTDHGAALDKLIGHSMGAGGDFGTVPASGLTPPNDETPHDERGSGEAADRIRTDDLLHGKQTL